jgi:hypothetical protein
MRKIDGIVLLIIIFLITCELFNGYDCVELPEKIKGYVYI